MKYVLPTILLLVVVLVGFFVIARVRRDLVGDDSLTKRRGSKSNGVSRNAVSSARLMELQQEIALRRAELDAKKAAGGQPGSPGGTGAPSAPGAPGPPSAEPGVEVSHVAATSTGTDHAVDPGESGVTSSNDENGAAPASASSSASGATSPGSIGGSPPIPGEAGAGETAEG